MMVDDFIKIEIDGEKKIIAALTKFPRQIASYMGHAGEDATKNVLFKTRGLNPYPPLTAANRPPVPYYERGVGTHYKSGIRATSEDLGGQWYTKVKGFSTEIGNRASYAKWAIGEKQARAMARIGWLKLVDVAKEKLAQIVIVYQKWTDKLIKDLGL